MDAKYEKISVKRLWIDKLPCFQVPPFSRAFGGFMEQALYARKLVDNYLFL